MLITLDEDFASPRTYGDAEGLFNEFQVFGKGPIEEGEFLFRIEIYLGSNRSGSLLIFHDGKGIQPIHFLQF